MPRIMTMNGHQQSVALAPLDLRTTNRERGSTRESSRTPDCKGRAGDTHVAADEKGDSLGALLRTGPELLGNGKTSPAVELGGHPPVSFPPTNPAHPTSLDTRHPPMVRSPSPSPKSVPGSDTNALDRRTPDKSSSTLPFRKRPFPTGTEILRKSPAAPGRGDSVSTPENTDSTHRLCSRVSKRATHVDRACVAPVPPGRPSEEAGQSRDGYPMRIMPAFNPYCRHPEYTIYQWPRAPVPCSVPALHLAHQTEQLLADVSLATRQDEDGDTPLHIAVVHGDEAVVHKLIYPLVLARRDLDIYNNLRQTPLHLAVITQQMGMVEALLKAGADPGALDRNGQTALHLCCEYGQRDCLSVVLSHSSSSSSSSSCPPSPCLEVRNYEGLSPLHLAVQGAHKDLARMLLDAGADINAMDIKSGQSPLMHAVGSNKADMVHFLIENNCDVNSQSYSGNTALHSACGRGQVDTVRLLLKSGADSSLKNNHNDTPVMVAKNKKVTDVLRGKGFKQTRSQDQPCVSVSPHRSTLRPNGSPSPNHGLGRSLSTTPHPPHSAPQSPRVPPTPSPHSQTTENLSGRQSPMDIQESQSERQSSSNMPAVDIRLSQRGTSSCPFYLPPRLHSPVADVPLRVVMSGHLYSPMAQRARYPDNPYNLNLLPHPDTVLPAYQMTISDSRPASGCSDHSEVSTMSISSGDKCYS